MEFPVPLPAFPHNPGAPDPHHIPGLIPGLSFPQEPRTGPIFPAEASAGLRRRAGSPPWIREQLGIQGISSHGADWRLLKSWDDHAKLDERDVQTNVSSGRALSRFSGGLDHSKCSFLHFMTQSQPEIPSKKAKTPIFPSFHSQLFPRHISRPLTITLEEGKAKKSWDKNVLPAFLRITKCKFGFWECKE